MPCYKPLKGWLSKQINPSGKRSIVFDVKDGFHDMPVQVPCGQCLGCRLDRASSWAMRCVHESNCYDQNCFITLTYSDDHLPKDSSLVKKHFQKFMKRFRKKVYPVKIRYFQCGEYGDLFNRPHYHAIIFNYDFPDKELLSDKKGVKLYRSDILEQLWPYGYASTGGVSYESAQYVARYCIKKVTGKRAREFYGNRVPEYIAMSRRPGLSRKWLDQFIKDVYPKDFITISGRKLKPAKYYDQIYDTIMPEEMRQIKKKRKDRAEALQSNTDENLAIRGYAKKLELQFFNQRNERK